MSEVRLPEVAAVERQGHNRQSQVVPQGAPPHASKSARRTAGPHGSLEGSLLPYCKGPIAPAMSNSLPVAICGISTVPQGRRVQRLPLSSLVEPGRRRYWRTDRGYQEPVGRRTGQ